MGPPNFITRALIKLFCVDITTVSCDIFAGSLIESGRGFRALNTDRDGDIAVPREPASLTDLRARRALVEAVRMRINDWRLNFKAGPGVLDKSSRISVARKEADSRLGFKITDCR